MYVCAFMEGVIHSRRKGNGLIHNKQMTTMKQKDWEMHALYTELKKYVVVVVGVFRQHLLLFSIRGLLHTMPIRHFDSKLTPFLSQTIRLY